MNEVSKLIDGSITEVQLDESVQSIGYCAFDSCTDLEKLTIGENVSTINSYAFSGCSNLGTVITEATTPPTNQSNFNDSPADTLIKVPSESETSYKSATNWKAEYITTEIPSDARVICQLTGGTVHYVPRDGTRSITPTFIIESLNGAGLSPTDVISLTFTNRLSNLFQKILYYNNAYAYPSLRTVSTSTYIGTLPQYCFQGSTATSYDLPSVNTVAQYAFYECSGLTSLDNIYMPNVTSIPSYCFDGSSNLATAHVPEGITNINSNAFRRCYSITELTIPSTVTAIGQSIYNLQNVESADMPTSTITISVSQSNAYYDSRDNCNAIIETATNKIVLGTRNSTIPSTVTAIHNKAFYYQGLTSFTIPAQITSIGNAAFVGNQSCTYTVAGTVPATVGLSDVFDNNVLIYVPTGTLQTYRTAWSNHANQIFEYGVADWRVIEQSCERDGNNKKTGYVITVERDYNPSSSTYNTTRTTRVEDLVKCDPSGNSFSKITQLADATTGKYIVVYDNGNGTGLALNASLIKNTGSTTTGINANNNCIDVSISDGNVSLSDEDTSTTAFDYDGNYISWTDTGTGTTYKLCGRSSGTTFEFSNPSHQVQPASTTYGFSFKDNSNNRLIALFTSSTSTTHKFRWESSSSATLNGVGIYKLN